MEIYAFLAGAVTASVVWLLVFRNNKKKFNLLMDAAEKRINDLVMKGKG